MGGKARRRAAGRDVAVRLGRLTGGRRLVRCVGTSARASNSPGILAASLLARHGEATDDRSTRAACVGLSSRCAGFAHPRGCRGGPARRGTGCGARAWRRSCGPSLARPSDCGPARRARSARLPRHARHGRRGRGGGGVAPVPGACARRHSSGQRLVAQRQLLVCGQQRGHVCHLRGRPGPPLSPSPPRRQRSQPAHNPPELAQDQELSAQSALAVAATKAPVPVGLAVHLRAGNQAHPPSQRGRRRTRRSGAAAYTKRCRRCSCPAASRATTAAAPSRSSSATPGKGACGRATARSHPRVIDNSALALPRQSVCKGLNRCPNPQPRLKTVHPKMYGSKSCA